MSTATNNSCAKCGASITPDQIAQRQAGLVRGQLLCPNCVDVIRQQVASSRSGLIRSEIPAADPTLLADTIGHSHPPVATAVASHAPASGTIHDEPIKLTDDSETNLSGPKSDHGIRTFGGKLGAVRGNEQYKRPLTPETSGATRCRTFHARMSDGALSFMDNAINDWLDAHPDVFVKFATTTVGKFDAKQHTEEHLVITLYY